MTPREGSILVIAGYAPSLTNFREPLLKTIRKAGNRVIAAAPGLLQDRSVSARLARLDVDCRNIPLSRTGLNPVADLLLLLNLANLMRVERPEVVLGYTAKPVIFGLLAAATARVPRRYALITGLGYAFADNGGQRAFLLRSIQKLLYRLALRRATKVFFQNHDDPELFRRLGLLPKGLPIVIVNGSGIDLEQFPRTPVPNSPIRFLLIARLIAAKGIREYARAAALLRGSYSDVEFHLVGGLDSNPDHLSADELRQWQEDRILMWHGEVTDVRPHIAACHVYVLPSYYREGTPRSVLEAMAMGRPVITTDAPGCRETVTDGENGFLVPPRAVEPLVEAMERFILHPELIAAMGLRSREIAENKFDVHKVNAQMVREMELA
ncbi:MAG: glycosyltransferase family 4 protein [Sphingomicrobium sp.]